MKNCEIWKSLSTSQKFHTCMDSNEKVSIFLNFNQISLKEIIKFMGFLKNKTFRYFEESLENLLIL